MASCCTPDGSCSTDPADQSAAVADAHATVYHVSGMTCGHCASTIDKAISELDDVLGVEVEVEVAAGRVTVTTGGEPADDLIAKAVDAAGYALTGRA
ncbi:heavy-metal-associated domain-containing protein [Streptomyces sp. H27-D2]|uniref:heavy-metal-associated domain-containing protein n=1 Tax=Streptomyces sp. H27-D2 TaxID=3046304 RepID=UPI002DB5FEC9|nr:heavy-metal-associated domain-containing protein [Streptomyces sp. H27-D2]MEC4015498.1 heavy-metal-associated domain-containing protein [Streptomyces sp. H27-D2]